jgi:hypothetical protein
VGAVPVTGGDRLVEERRFVIVVIRVEVVFEAFIELDAAGEKVWMSSGRLALGEKQAERKQTRADLAELLGLSALIPDRRNINNRPWWSGPLQLS